MRKYLMGILTGIIISTLIGGFAVSQILSANISYDNTNSGLESTNAQDAIDEIYKYYSCKYSIGYEWNFDYTGGEQTFVAPCEGVYKLEVWGAQGGSATSTYKGGYGSYSYGNITLLTNETIYINVGGAGSVDSDNKISTCVTGGYNGGGMACGYQDKTTGAGGGATHIATSSGILSSLSNSVSSILIVAGGGGGGGYQSSTMAGGGGSAGGIKGNAGTYVTNYSSLYVYNGATQTSGGTYTPYGSYTYSSSSFGQGGGGAYSNGNASGGGGGLYGGGCGNLFFGAGGGSGYIGNSLLTDKAMYCYNCTTSTEESTYTVSNTCVNSTASTNCSKTGNGYAKITLVSIN